MSGTGGFQTVVNVQPTPAVRGDAASTNTDRFSVLAGPGAFVAGPNGVNIGYFAWASPPDDPNNAPSFISNSGTGPVTGFVAREQQGLNPIYLSNAGMTIQKGFPVTLNSGGDFFVDNDGAAQALIGQKAYANFADGKITFAATGTVTSGASATGSTVTPETFSVTGSIGGNILTVTAVGSGSVYPGSTISGSGVASGTMVVSQINGTANGAGTYYVSIPQQTVASTTISGTYGLLTIGTATGNFAVNDVISGGLVVAGTVITANVSGIGGTGGTMIVNNNTNVTTATITASAINVETKWTAMSSAAPGEKVKISSVPLG